MKSHTPTITVLGVSLVSLLTAHASLAEAAMTPCNKTADQMLQACIADVRDNFKTTQANCTNISDSTDRQACREDAATVRDDEEIPLCEAQFEARNEACETLDEVRYDPDPLLDVNITFIDPDKVNKRNKNPYVSIVTGHTYVLRAGEEGEEEIVVVHVTGESKEVNGVSCRVVVDAVVVAENDEEDGGVDYIPVELTDDWFAQDTEGNVYYCGELARNYEDGQLVDLDGSFEAGIDFAKAGIIIMNDPEPELAHRQEFALGEAEDIVQYVSTAASPAVENENFPCRREGVDRCLQTYDFSALAPDAAEFKYYLPGVGFVLAVSLDEDGMPTDDREELVCVGDSLRILKSPSCQIEDPEELLEELCELSPDAFCGSGRQHGHHRGGKRE